MNLIIDNHLLFLQKVLEYDINENALRTDMLKPSVKIKDGNLLLNSSIGIGFYLSEMSKNYLNQYYEL